MNKMNLLRKDIFKLSKIEVYKLFWHDHFFIIIEAAGDSDDDTIYDGLMNPTENL